MPIPGDYPGMTNSQLDSYISDFLTAIYGEEVRDKFARIAYLIGHQIPDSVEPSVQAAAASAAEAAEEAENAASSANSAAGSANSAYGSMQNASQSATSTANSATAAKTAQTAAEAAQEAAENAAQTATDAAGGDFLPKSGGTLTGTLKETAGSYVWHGVGISGTEGYVNIAEFSLADTKYQNCPICLTVFRRRTLDRSRLIISFVGDEAGDPDVECFRFEGAGSPTDFYLYKSATSTWQLYIKKTEAYDNIGIGEFHADFEYITYKVTFKDAQVSSVPDGAIAATQLPVAAHTHNYAGSSSAGGAANSAKKLSSAQTIDGVAFDGSSNIIHYGTCSTAAATAAKVVQCDGFKLVTGARIAVKFSHSNTAASPTLNVNGTGAKRLCKYGTSYVGNVGNDWHDDEVVEFVYDGTQYQMVGTKLTVSYQDVEFKPYESTRSGNYFNVHAEKYGRVVTLCVSSIIQFPSESFSGTLDTVTISADFRPTINQYVHGMGISGSSQVGNFRARINTDGTVTMVVPDARLAERHFTITYMAESGLS